MSFTLLLLAACHGSDSKQPGDSVEPVTCGAGEVLDGEVCVPVACGVGKWGNVVGALVYVDVDAAEGGDGSAAAPMRSIQAGLDLAAERDGGVVAVAAGTYLETVAMGDDHRKVTLAGRCLEMVTIDGSEGGEVPAIDVKGITRTPKVGIEGVTVTGGNYAGLSVQHATLAVRASEVRESTGVGVTVADAKVTLAGVGVYGTETDEGGNYGRGIEASNGAVLLVTGCIIEGNTEFGVVAATVGTTVDLVDTEVLDSGKSGIGVSGGATLTATRCTLQRNTGWGVALGNAGTTVHLQDTKVLDTSPNTDVKGNGIEVSDGAMLTATGCTIQGNAEADVMARNVGTTVSLVDTEILDTSPASSDGGGYGIEVSDGAGLTATGCTLQGNSEVGVAAAGAGSIVDLVDTDVLGTRRGRVTGFALGVVAQQDALLKVSDGEISGTEGPGLYAASARLELARVEVKGNQFAGAVVLGGSLTMTASTITDTLPDAEWGGGFGIYASDDFGSPALTLTESTIGRHAYAAIWLDGQGAYDVQRNILSGSQGVDDDGWILHGNAVFAENGVTAWDGASGLRLAGNTFDGAAEIAVLLDGASTELDGNTFTSNGVELWQQRCEGIVPLPEGAPGWEICPPDGNLLTAYDLVYTSLYLPEVEPL